MAAAQLLAVPHLEIRIADFGLSKFIDIQTASQLAARRAKRRRRGAWTETDDPRMAMSGQVGTPDYMAPEMAKKGTPMCNKKCDIWSLGCVILEMASGRFVETKRPRESWRAWLKRHTEHVPAHYKCRAALLKLLGAMLHPTAGNRISTTGLVRTPLVALHLPRYSSGAARNASSSGGSSSSSGGRAPDATTGLRFNARMPRRKPSMVPQSVPVRSNHHRARVAPTPVLEQRQRMQLQTLTNATANHLAGRAAGKRPTRVHRRRN